MDVFSKNKEEKLPPPKENARKSGKEKKTLARSLVALSEIWGVLSC